MELTGLKTIVNSNGGNFTDSTTVSSNSKTIGYKQVNNLPKFAEGTPPLSNSFGGWHTDQYVPKIMSTAPTGVDTSGITPNVYSQTTYGTSSPGQYFNSPAATAGAKNVHAPVVPTNNGGSGQKRIGSGAAGGKGVNWSGIGSVITSGVQFAGDAINSFSVNETGEDLQNKYGTSQQNVAGVGYDSQNMIDANKELDRVKKENTGNTLKAVGSGAALGAAAGSVIPGLGTAVGAVVGAGVGLITGIFGGESRKRRYREMLAKQNAKINALQDSSRFSAQTKAIQIQNAKEYGDSESQYLYGAKEGKQPEVDPKTMLSKDKLLSITPNGYTIDNADSMVEPGETLFNTETGSMTQVPRLASGKLHPGDIQPAKIGNAAVFTDRHKDPITGKSFAQAAIDGDDDPYNLLYRQKVLVNDKKNNKGLMKAKNGRLPKFDNGWLGNAITSGLGALGGLSQWWQANNSSSRKTNVYKQNDYEGVSLDILSRLGISPFPTMQKVRNAEARANRAIDMSGGLTTGQRTLTRLAALNNTQRAVADALQNIQMQNNNYFADYAKTALAAGAANAQRAMQANMYDEEMYAKAHAARQQGMQMGMRNMIDSVGSYWQNAFKYNQFDKMMNLYQQDIDLKKDEIKALLSNKNAAKSVYPPVMNNYFVNKASKNEKRLRNPFAYTKPATYHDLSGGKWLATPYYQFPNIPKININTGKYM